MEKKNQEIKRKMVVMTSGNGGKWGEVPPLFDHSIDAI